MAATAQRYPSGLKPNLTPGAQVVEVNKGVWRLEIPSGPKGQYRLAQLDDYGLLPRRSFHWKTSCSFELRLRASARELPGTWGVGLWNDPFGAAILKGNKRPRLPTLPKAAWFFHASAPNYLSLDDDLPARGWLASSFSSPRLSFLYFALSIPILPLLALPRTARVIRSMAGKIIHQDSIAMSINPTEWHHYRMEWKDSEVCFMVDGKAVLNTPVRPHGPLGVVLWIDNQFASFLPSGRLSYGTLPTHEAAWIEFSDFSCISQDIV